MANNNPNYLVIIQQAGGARIVAPLPDTFAFDSKSEYSAPYAQGLFGDNSLVKGAQSLTGIRLTSQANTAQLWQGSTETSLHLDLEFHAETDPVTDVQQPILALMKMATASVSGKTGFLVAPGPSITLDSAGNVAVGLANTAASNLGTLASAVGLGGTPKPGNMTTPTDTQNGQGKSTSTPSASVRSLKDTVANQISIRIGRYAFFDSVVITNVQQTYSHQIDVLTGLPMHAKVAVDFTPLFLVVQSDLDIIFSAGQ